MSGSLTKTLAALLILTGWAGCAYAQNPSDPAASDRAASFVMPGGDTGHEAGFSGLATAPPETLSPQTAPVPPAVTPAPVAAPVSSLVPTPVASAPLPVVSNESVGLQSGDALAATMWKGTPRPIAEHLLSMLTLTASPVLNDLARRLLVTAAAPPEGDSQIAQSLVSTRIEKLIMLGDAADAAALAQTANPKLIDDVTFHLVAQNMLLSSAQDPCGSVMDWAKARSGADWQKLIIACQLRAKDNQPAQVGLDVMRAQKDRDAVFVGLADRNILGTAKALPQQLTPLTPETLALLRLINLPLPPDLYGHADFTYANALLQIPAQQDVAQLALAERAAERGVIGKDAVEALYRNIIFAPDILASPLTANETGLRLHALLFRAAENDNDPAKRIAYALKFVQSAAPALLNGAGGIAADMLGAVKPDAALADNAVLVAQIYVLANRGDLALPWLRIATRTPANIDASQSLWPQFVLAGLESANAYAGELGRWLDAFLKMPDPQGDLRDRATTSLLLLDAAGFAVPDTEWAKIITAPHNEKRVALPPLLFDRLQNAGFAGRGAETILLSAALAGEGDIALPVAVTITRALREAGFKAEAAIFARQMLALLTTKMAG